MNTEMLKSYLKMLLKMFNANTDKKATMLLEMLKRANVEEGKLQLITNSTIKKQIYFAASPILKDRVLSSFLEEYRRR